MGQYKFHHHHHTYLQQKLCQTTYSRNMPVLKLFYGDMPFWRAEVCRLALHLGKVPFEDVRMKTPEEREAFRASGKAPFGQVPILEVDGKVISQTGGIARYCGKLGGFYPRDDDFAAAKIDEIIDTATDLTVAVGRTFGMQPVEKEAARSQLATVTLPKYCKALEKIMLDNGATGFYVGSSMTIADIAMWRLWGWLTGGIVDGLPKDLLEAYPQLLRNFKSTDAHPEISAWMAEHYPKA